VLAILAVCFRLVLPVSEPPVQADPSASQLLALLGEHALCLATAGAVPDSSPQTPPAHQHDDSRCCLWHAGAGFAPPPVFAAAFVAFADPFRADLPAATDLPPVRPPGISRARGPPTET
jgi:hypothetical protein